MDAQKPQWMMDHERSDAREFADAKKRDEEIARTLKRIEDKLDPNHEDYINKEIEKKLDPVVKTYDTASTLGKWAMTILVSLSLISGIIWAVVQTIHSK